MGLGGVSVTDVQCGVGQDALQSTESQVEVAKLGGRVLALAKSPQCFATQFNAPLKHRDGRIAQVVDCEAPGRAIEVVQAEPFLFGRNQSERVACGCDYQSASV